MSAFEGKAVHALSQTHMSAFDPKRDIGHSRPSPWNVTPRLFLSAVASGTTVFGPWATNRRLDQRPTSQDARGYYPTTMMREPSTIMLIVLSAAYGRTPSLAQTGNILSDNYSIMVPGRKGVQTEGIQTERIQTGTAGTMACAEI